MLSTLGTPHHNGARIKGVGADCGQFPLAVFAACKLIPDVIPERYSAQFYLNRSEEWYLNLCKRLGKELRLLVRNPNKLSDFPEAEKVTGDYGDVESLDRAFTGVSSAFIVSGYAEPGERAKLHRNAFQAAQRAGVRYVIYLSTLGASPDSRFPMSRDHYESEHFLKATGVPHTILQDSYYSELAVQMFNDEGVMKGPGGRGKVSWVGREEIAEAAAKLLASNTRNETKALQPEPLFDVARPSHGAVKITQQESMCQARADAN